MFRLAACCYNFWEKVIVFSHHKNKTIKYYLCHNHFCPESSEWSLFKNKDNNSYDYMLLAFCFF